MKKKLSLMIALALTITSIAGCGQSSTTAATSAATTEAAETTAATEATEATAAIESAETSDEQADVVFKPGIWCTLDEKSALIIREDGESAAIMSVSENIGVPVRYEHNGADYIFHMGSVDNNTSAVVKIEDSDFPVATITWNRDTGTEDETYRWVRTGDQIGFDLGTWEDKENNARFTFVDSKTAVLENLETGLINNVEYKYCFGNEANFVFYNKADEENVLEQYVDVDFVSENQMAFTFENGTIFNLTKIAAETSGEQSDAVFKPGIWCTLDEKTALIINEDGHSAAIMDVEYNIGTPIDYEHNGADYIFHMGSADDNTPAVVKIADSDFPVATITWGEETGMGEVTYRWVRTGDQIGFDLGTWEDAENNLRITFIDNKSAFLENLQTGFSNYFDYKYSFGSVGNFIFYDNADENVLEQCVAVDFVSENQMILTNPDGTVFNLSKVEE